MQKLEQRWTILLYSILLVNFLVILGYMVFLKSETLLENTRYSEISSKLSKNIEERGISSIDYGIFLNQNGNWFTNTTSCPMLSFSGTSSGSSYSESIPTSIWFDGQKVYCSGSSIAYPGTSAILTYSPNFQSFSGITFGIHSGILFGSTTLTWVLNDPNLSRVTLTLSGSSGYDANFNSDNYQYGSTGGVSYPNNFGDDDDLARKISFWYIQKDKNWRNIFWNTTTSAKRIRSNSNNTGALAILADQTSTGMLYLDLNGGYMIKIYEFDISRYSSTRELRIIENESSSSLTGGIGYLQSNLSIGSGSINAKKFNLKDKSYGIFLASSGALWEFLRYQFHFTNQSGAMIYSVPLDDSDPYKMVYYGNDILIDSENKLISKEQEITRPK